jgi:pimeloyl-ACP methyl ester carboxylesterase
MHIFMQWTTTLSMKKFIKWITICIAIIGIAAIVDFLIWRDQQIRRLESKSSLATTSNGIIEYATVGEGSAVLVLHGTLGGYDQTQILAKMLAPPAYQFIFVSRPGYLRTPLATGDLFEAQADAYASLLDELGIDRVAVIAISGGGPSALQFALRHPDRCWGMILIAANSDVNAGKVNKGETDGQGQPPLLLSNIILSDFTSWLIIRASGVMPRMFLTSLVGADYVEAVLKDPQRGEYFADFMNSIVLLSQRRVGTLNDGKQFLNFTGYPFENIPVPTLILHGTEDFFVPSAEGAYLDEILPNSEYIEIEGGTHFMLISHGDVLAPMINNFLYTHAPPKLSGLLFDT